MKILIWFCFLYMAYSCKKRTDLNPTGMIPLECCTDWNFHSGLKISIEDSSKIIQLCYTILEDFEKGHINKLKSKFLDTLYFPKTTLDSYDSTANFSYYRKNLNVKITKESFFESILPILESAFSFQGLKNENLVKEIHLVLSETPIYTFEKPVKIYFATYKTKAEDYLFTFFFLKKDDIFYLAGFEKL